MPKIILQLHGANGTGAVEPGVGNLLNHLLESPLFYLLDEDCAWRLYRLMTTFTSYGEVSQGRQKEILDLMGRVEIAVGQIGGGNT